MIDPHWVISAIVVAKAMKVMSEVKRSWSYGSKQTEKRIEKSVMEIRTKEKPPTICPMLCMVTGEGTHESRVIDKENENYKLKIKF